MGITEEVVILIICLILSAFFSGVEIAFFSLSDIKIQHLLEHKKKGIVLVKRLKANSDRLIITILIGNNLVNIAASAIATSIAIHIFKSNGVGIAIGIMTFVILIFGEILPKTIAIAKNEWIAANSAPIIFSLQWILFPLIKALELFSIFISKPFNKNADPVITESEIKSVVTLGEQVGEVEKNERIMIHNIFRFSDLEVSDIMTDRMQIFSINCKKDIQQAAKEIIKNGYSRIPVYEDKVDNIIGVLYAKDILKTAFVENNEKPTVKNYVRKAKFIPEYMKIDVLLKEFQKEKIHLALVVDEHGGISGLITIEDLIEEIVGEIYDETDKENILIKKADKHKSLVKGETEIEVINDVLKLGLNEKEDYETISGFILEKLQYIPTEGEKLELKNCIISIVKADEKRIIEVEIEKLAKKHEEDQ